MPGVGFLDTSLVAGAALPHTEGGWKAFFPFREVSGLDFPREWSHW